MGIRLNSKSNIQDTPENTIDTPENTINNKNILDNTSNNTDKINEKNLKSLIKGFMEIVNKNEILTQEDLDQFKKFAEKTNDTNLIKDSKNFLPGLIENKENTKWYIYEIAYSLNIINDEQRLTIPNNIKNNYNIKN